MTELIAELRRDGYDVEVGASSHWRVTKDGAYVMTLSASPKNHHTAVKSARRLLRRVTREETP